LRADGMGKRAACQMHPSRQIVADGLARLAESQYVRRRLSVIILAASIALIRPVERSLSW